MGYGIKVTYIHGSLVDYFVVHRDTCTHESNTLC